MSLLITLFSPIYYIGCDISRCFISIHF